MLSVSLILAHAPQNRKPKSLWQVFILILFEFIYFLITDKKINRRISLAYYVLQKNINIEIPYLKPKSL